MNTTIASTRSRWPPRRLIHARRTVCDRVPLLWTSPASRPWTSTMPRCQKTCSTQWQTKWRRSLAIPNQFSRMSSLSKIPRGLNNPLFRWSKRNQTLWATIFDSFTTLRIRSRAWRTPYNFCSPIQHKVALTCQGLSKIKRRLRLTGAYRCRVREGERLPRRVNSSNRWRFRKSSACLSRERPSWLQISGGMELRALKMPTK